MPTPQCSDWIDAKMATHGRRKGIPPQEWCEIDCQEAELANLTAGSRGQWSTMRTSSDRREIILAEKSLARAQSPRQSPASLMPSIQGYRNRNWSAVVKDAVCGVLSCPNAGEKHAIPQAELDRHR